jgi:hypothetical protein
MALFIYPHTAADLDTAGACSRDLNLPSPVRWGDDLMDQLIAELVSQRIASAADSFNALGVPVIVLAGIDRDRLHQILRWYKARSQWPIFATVTEQSLRMPLQELLRHLLQDRATEAAARSQKKM